MINKFTHLQSTLPTSTQGIGPSSTEQIWISTMKVYNFRIKKLLACIIRMKLLQKSLDQILQHSSAFSPLPPFSMRLITYLYIKIIHGDEEPNSQLGICFNKFANLARTGVAHWRFCCYEVTCRKLEVTRSIPLGFTCVPCLAVGVGHLGL